MVCPLPHEQVLAAFDRLKKTRRQKARFAWLVESCSHYLDGAEADTRAQGVSGGDGTGTIEEEEIEITRTLTASKGRRGRGASVAAPSTAETKAALRAAQVQLCSCCLVPLHVESKARWAPTVGGAHAAAWPKRMARYCLGLPWLLNLPPRLPLGGGHTRPNKLSRRLVSVSHPTPVRCS